MNDSLDRAIERATEAWRTRWAAEQQESKPEVHRYRVSFTCDAETFETVKLALKGFGLARTTYRLIDEEL